MDQAPAVVLDTNVVMSAALRPDSSSRRALLKALGTRDIVVSEAVWSEWQEVLHRPRFDRYFTPAARRTDFLHALAPSVRWCAVTLQVGDCQDPKEDKFLALTAECHATRLVSGDDDLLSMHPWRGIPIMSPAAFIAA